jgi:hypothetical protein
MEGGNVIMLETFRRPDDKIKFRLKLELPTKKNRAKRKLEKIREKRIKDVIKY